jgi:hypothetical protein
MLEGVGAAGASRPSRGWGGVMGRVVAVAGWAVTWLVSGGAWSVVMLGLVVGFASWVLSDGRRTKRLTSLIRAGVSGSRVPEGEGDVGGE